MPTLRILAAIAILISLGADAAAKSDTTSVEFSTLHYNFGAIREDNGPSTAAFKITNTGAYPLIINRVSTSCGCTTASYPKKPIAPGASDSIVVKYDPAGRPGRFLKRVKVMANTSPAATNLDISGVVIGEETTVSRRFPVEKGPLRMRTPDTHASFKKKRSSSATLEVYNISGDTIVPTFADSLPWVSFKAFPEVLLPGEQGVFMAYYQDTKDSGFYGNFSDSVAVTLNQGSPREYRFFIPVSCMVMEDFSGLTDKQKANAPACSLSTQRIEFGSFSETPAPQAVTITNTGKSPLDIRRIYPSSDRITVDTSSVPARLKKGNSATFTVSVEPSRIPNSILSAAVYIITNDPFNPLITVRATGEKTK